MKWRGTITYMNDMKILRAEARRIANQARGLIGPLPTARVICENSAFFLRLRGTGATWAQIAVLMEAEGLRSRKGKVIGPEVFRALYSRAARAPSTTQTAAQSPPASTKNNLRKQVTTRTTLGATDPAAEPLAQTISRAARLRGITSNKGSDDDET